MMLRSKLLTIKYPILLTVVNSAAAVNAKINEVKKEIPSNISLAPTTALNAKINEFKKIPNITNLATTTAFTAAENKIPNVSNVVKRSDYNTKISEIEKKIATDHDHDKYIITQKLNKLTLENFERLNKQI